MQLSKQESRLILTALRTLERNLAGELERLSGCSNLLIHPTYGAFDHHQQAMNLWRRLANDDTNPLNPSEMELATRGLSRYADVLADSVEKDEMQSDDFTSAEQSRREVELKAAALLLGRLRVSRPAFKRLQAVSARSAM